MRGCPQRCCAAGPELLHNPDATGAALGGGIEDGVGGARLQREAQRDRNAVDSAPILEEVHYVAEEKASRGLVPSRIERNSEPVRQPIERAGRSAP